MLIEPKGNEAFMSLSPQLVNTLRIIHEGTVANGIHFGNPANPMIATLIRSGHVETNSDRVDPNDGRRVTVSLTALGHEANGTAVAAASTAPISTPTQETTMETTATAVVDAIAEKVRRARTTVVPEVKLSSGYMVMPTSSARRGGNRKEIYAFGQLEAPRPDGAAHSFFVPATFENPTPADTIRAAVSSANARYKEKGGAQFKHFVVDNDAEFGVAGVRVFRVK